MKRQTRTRPSLAKARRVALLLPFLVLLGVSLLIYGNTLNNDFVHDDEPLVTRNDLIRDPGQIGRIFGSGYWTTGDRTVPELYRPLVIASLALNYGWGGLNPAGYHLVNLFLHAVVSWLVFVLVRPLSERAFLAWGSALLFAVHPLHTEAVTPVVGRSETMAAGFLLGALILDRLSLRREGRRVLLTAAAGVCFLAGLLSKEHVIVFPLVALMSDLLLPVSSWSGRVRRRLLDYSFYLALLVFYLALRVRILGAVAASAIEPLDNPLVTASPLTAKLTALITVPKYVGLLFWPLHLSADYSFRQIPLITGWNDLRLAGAVLVLAGGAGLVLWGWRQSRLAAWAAVFFGLTLFPVSNLLLPIGTIFGERLVYLPSLGFCLLIAALFDASHRRYPRLTLILLLLVAGACSLRTVIRNRDWRNEATFILATAAQAPFSAKAQHNLGTFWEDGGDLARAETAYGRAAELAPEWADTHYNLAGVLGRRGRTEEAIAAYRRAIRLNPYSLPFRLNLGFLLYQNARYLEAVSLYRETLQSRGESAPLYTNLGAALLALDRGEEATASYRKAVSLEPDNPDYQRNLGEALVRQGHTEEGLQWLRSAVQLHPRADLQAALGVSLLESDRSAEAVEALRQATRLDPSDPRYRYHLARALEAAGQIEAAIGAYRRVLESSPDAAPALRDLGLLLARQGEGAEALRLLERAESRDPALFDETARAALEQLRRDHPSQR